MESIMHNIIAVLYTTIGTEQDAEKIAELAIFHKMAACVNIIPNGRSVYFWENKIEKNTECYMIFKTTVDQIDALEQFIIQNHPYDTPAILKFESEASESFASYISKSISNRRPDMSIG
jgi:periplasmic divalent cation tolerance protein